MENLSRHVLWISKKALGVVLILHVPWAIAVPFVPGDWMLVTGACLVSDRLGNWVIKLIKKHYKIIIPISIVWTVIAWSSFIGFAWNKYSSS